MAEVLFGKEIVNIKHLRKKVVNNSTDYGARNDAVPDGPFTWNSALPVV